MTYKVCCNFVILRRYDNLESTRGKECIVESDRAFYSEKLKSRFNLADAIRRKSKATCRRQFPTKLRLIIIGLGAGTHPSREQCRLGLDNFPSAGESPVGRPETLFSGCLPSYDPLITN